MKFKEAIKRLKIYSPCPDSSELPELPELHYAALQLGVAVEGPQHPLEFGVDVFATPEGNFECPKFKVVDGVVFYLLSPDGSLPVRDISWKKFYDLLGVKLDLDQKESVENFFALRFGRFQVCQTLEEIEEAYSSVRSCTSKRPKLLKFFAENKNFVRLVVFENASGAFIFRALLWDTDQGAYLDRRYPQETRLTKEVTEWVKSNLPELWIRSGNDEYDFEEAENSSSCNDNFQVRAGGIAGEKIPYMDSFKYGWWEDGDYILSTVPEDGEEACYDHQKGVVVTEPPVECEGCGDVVDAETVNTVVFANGSESELCSQCQYNQENMIETPLADGSLLALSARAFCEKYWSDALDGKNVEIVYGATEDIHREIGFAVTLGNGFSVQPIFRAFPVGCRRIKNLEIADVLDRTGLYEYIFEDKVQEAWEEFGGDCGYEIPRAMDRRKIRFFLTQESEDAFATLAKAVDYYIDRTDEEFELCEHFSLMED